MKRKMKKEILSEDYYRQKKSAYNFASCIFILLGLASLITGYYVDDIFVLFIFSMIFLFLVSIIGLLFVFRKNNLEEHYKIYQAIKNEEIRDEENRSEGVLCPPN